jgi:hypothetical protein
MLVLRKPRRAQHADLADHPGKPADAEAIWRSMPASQRETRNEQDHQSDHRGVRGAACRGEGSTTGLQQR